MIRLTAFCLSCALVLAGCDALAPSDPVAFSHVDGAGELRVQISGTTLIRSQSDWARFWESHGGAAPLPGVDFERQSVVGVFYGGTFHGGCGSYIEVVKSVEVESGVVKVTVGPLPDLGACRAVVYPIDLVVVNAKLSRVQFEGDLPR